MLDSLHPAVNSPQRPSIIVHAKETWYSSIAQGKFDFFEKLAAYARKLRIDSFIVDVNSGLSRNLLRNHHLHIMVGLSVHTDRPAFYAMPSYIWGFWYLDPKGVYWNSSVSKMTFAPEEVEQKSAEYFFNGVSGYMLRENISKFEQSNRQGPALASAKAAVFLQEIDKYKTPVHYLDSRKMVATAARSTTDIVYVKLHPAQSDRYRRLYSDLCTGFDNVVISDRSIHDLSEASEIIITQNSAAGFEALMQKKPVITCARTDYHHATIIARSEDELAAAMHSATERQASFPYERYFYWFLGQQMLEPQKAEFETRAWNKIGWFFDKTFRD